ncbi:MAG TPA: haloacid dehalogenase type II [Acidimicrobiia bacterium]|nr:haloacid dehalogenase type II [Acidimicrobiia bacterium]
MSSWFVFDVNETLLDVSPLGTRLARALPSGSGAAEWFARLLHRSLVANHLDDHRAFEQLGAEVLRSMASRGGHEISGEEAHGLMEGMGDLPAHPDARPGLEALAGKGERLAALTNSSSDLAHRQLENAGLTDLFERIMSVDAVGRFKPAPEVYRHAADECGSAIEEMTLVAAHDWDVAGAQAAGMRGCYLARRPWGLFRPEPDRSVNSLTDLVPTLEAEWTR